MDFGSVSMARIKILNRNQALNEQDKAAEECSMPFRAPELFDVSFLYFILLSLFWVDSRI